MPETESPDSLAGEENPDDQDLPVVSPDITEEKLEIAMVDANPGDTAGIQPVVGLGGSAGSISALRTFFAHMPGDSGLAFVVVLHLSPEHESSLASLLQNTTAMPVLQVNETVKVESNHVYVISPAKRLFMADGELRVSELEPRRGRHVVVDLFFRALADTHGPRGAAVVLSGADGDGAIGIKRVKERGGLCIAQEPGEAEYDSMPKASIATGLVDWVLPVAHMPERVLDYFRRESRVRLPSEEDPREEAAPLDGERSLREILAFLRMRTGRDFSYYKRATVLRRLGRRMQVNGLDDLPAYLEFLRTHPAEAPALLQDLLISVTNFFRDREAFTALETQVPMLFTGKNATDQVRVWVAGCATGEEAYSVAMLLAEQADKLEQPPACQVFATDIDEVSIRAAREAFYPDTIVADVSPERLRRFFGREPGGYRLKREIRETVLFAPHDLLKDAPFSRLDLITCRNLLIYLNRAAQSRVFDIFHFALRQGGILFLGTSESAEDAGHLFGLRDKKHRVYVRQMGARPAVPPALLAGPGALTLALHAPVLGPVHSRLLATPPPAPVSESASLTWGEVHFRLLESFAPPSVLVDADSTIIHLSENAGRFLRFAGGEPSVNLLRVIDPLLRLELRTALFRARQAGETVEARDVPAEIEGARRTVTLRVRPALDLAPGYLLVIFEEGNPGPAATPLVTVADPALLQLERELDQLRSQHQETIEQYEASTEELKASNEELQAMNEELRSATEELETSREELQSVNEELITVNHELKGNLDELGRSNSDLQNLMASTNIATVFVDRELCIKRFTPAAVEIFNLIPADVGRPLYDLRGTLDYDALSADAERVLAQLTPVEQEIRADDGRIFLARLLPYRTMDDHIAGVGLTFIDITARRRAEAAQYASEERLNAFVRRATVPVTETDLSGQYIAVNAPYCALVGRSEAELIGLKLANITHPEDVPHQDELVERLKEDGIPFENEKRYLLPDGTPIWAHCSVSAARDGEGKVASIITVSVDISERKQAEAAMLRSEGRFRLIFESARDFAIFTMDRDSVITGWNPGAESLFGWRAEEIFGRSIRDLLTQPDIDAQIVEHHTEIALREGRCEGEHWFLRRDGSRFWGAEVLTPMLENGEVTGFLKIMRDRTEELQAREGRRYMEEERARLFAAEQVARQEAVAANVAKDRFLASLSHELRTPLTPIQMAVFALKREKRLSAAGQEMLSMIGRNLDAELQLIDDLLDVNRIIHGKLELRPAPLDLHECIRSATEVCQNDFATKSQRLILALDAKRHELPGDSSRLRQVFWNLLKNAAKFTPDGGSITVRSGFSADRIVVEVADTGIGMEADALEKVFGAFEQGGAEVTQEYGGLGLGLAISRAIVRAHGGELTAASAGRNQGATLTVALPLEPDAQGPTNAGEGAA